MAREFSKQFYKSKSWQKIRDYIYKRDSGLCQDCLSKGRITVGKEVHHIEFLTPKNITDANVSLGADNLILLCKDCHHRRHHIDYPIADDLMFDEFGNLIKRT